MELVYLWVEKYKNIHKQGFNFSPRFHCAYDEEKNELTIDENKDYIPDFFGENINVTAIVGKNGSGKSSLLKCIENFWNRDFIQKGIIILYRINATYYCVFSHRLKPHISGIEKINFVERDLYFRNRNGKDHNIGSDWVVFQEKTGDKGLKYFGFFGNPLSYHSVDMENNYQIGDNHFFIPQYVDTYRRYSFTYQSLKDIFEFDFLRLRLNNRVAKSFKKTLSDRSQEKTVQNIIDLTQNLQDHFYHHGYLQSYEIGNYIIPEVSQQLALSSLIGFVELYLLNGSTKNHDSILLTCLQELYQNKKQKNNDFLLLYHDIKTLFENVVTSFKDYEKAEELVKEIIASIEYLKNLKFSIDAERNEHITDISLKNIDIDILKKLLYLNKMFEHDDYMAKQENSLRMIELDLINSDTQATYQTVSEGEKQFLRLAVEFIQLLGYIADYTNNKSHIILADEIDNALHPEWKKKVILKLVQLFQAYNHENNKVNIHMIFSTHSPFLLSDIPKQNIIFLDRDTNGNCKVVDGLKEKKETFGANIHTLLSDSFFMKDGLMGEFAKSKIDEVIKYLKPETIKESTIQNDDEAQQIISIIGEPVLQTTLQSMLDEKIYSNETKLEKLKRKQKEIEEAIKREENKDKSDEKN